MPIQAINVRNQFRGKIREIIRGDVVEHTAAIGRVLLVFLGVK